MSLRPDAQDTCYLWDMLKYAERVLELTGRTHFEAYCQDWMLQLAMERAIEVIGEAASKVSQAFRMAHPEIPWRRIIDQRNFLVH